MSLTGSHDVAVIWTCSGYLSWGSSDRLLIGVWQFTSLPWGLTSPSRHRLSTASLASALPRARMPLHARPANPHAPIPTSRGFHYPIPDADYPMPSQANLPTCSSYPTMSNNYDPDRTDRPDLTELLRSTAHVSLLVASPLPCCDGSPFPIRAKLPAGHRHAHVAPRARVCLSIKHRGSGSGIRSRSM